MVVQHSPLQRATPAGGNARAMAPFRINTAVNTPTRDFSNYGHFGDLSQPAMDDFSHDLLGLGPGESGFGVIAEVKDEEILAMDLEAERMEQELARLNRLKEAKRAKRLRPAELQRKIDEARSELGSLDFEEQEGEGSHVPVATAQRQIPHDVRNPYQTPVAWDSSFRSQHSPGYASVDDSLEEVRHKKVKTKLRMIREGIVRELRFKGNIGDTDKRTLLDFEAEIGRAFEEQELNLSDSDPCFQQLVLFVVQSFLHPDGKAYEMYKQCYKSWNTYDDFVKELYLRFLKPNSGATIIAEWEALAQGSKGNPTVDAAVSPQRGNVDSPGPRFVQGGRTYADAVTAWQVGRRGVKQERACPSMIQEKESSKGPCLPPTPLLAGSTQNSASSLMIPASASVAITKKKSKSTLRDRQPQVDDKKSKDSLPGGSQQIVADWKEVVGSPSSIGKVYSIVARVGGYDAVLLEDPGANVQMLDTRFVMLHRFCRIDHSQHWKIATGFKGSYGTSAAGTVQKVEVNARVDRVYIEVGAVDGFDGILGTEWLEAVGAQQCWTTDKLVLGGHIVGGEEVPCAQKHTKVRVITATVAADSFATPETPSIDPERTITISENGPAMFPAWASALEELKAPGAALTMEEAGNVVQKFGEEIGVICPDGKLAPGLPPLRTGMNHTFVMKRDAPPLPKRAIRYPVKYEQQMREKEAKYISDGRWYRSSDPEDVPTFVVPKRDIAKARMVFDERAQNQQKELV
ncbi:hypothetical protein DFS34DRAFT_691424 [Phlyctochytrium arcticum]|nr:hypothetical protein DFS34DRAFT_698684 [Phlyctochytrium arcticum]KAI9103988.1 hypothetical protein DFS34DRAFT_691424 [Phlyctochytrium arcticum]